MTVTERGFGKRTHEGDYRRQSRGGKGIITLKVTGKTGNVVGSIFVGDDDELMLISDKGKIIRIRMKEVRVVGRNTQGVRLMEMEDEDRLKAIARPAERVE